MTLTRTRRPVPLPAALLLLAGVLAGCAGNDSRSDPEDSEPTPTATEVGTADGDPVSAVIGPGGGTISTPDGRLTVVIPEGALNADTEIGIQPITNTAHGGLGTGYRLTPDGQTFQQPIGLVFAYTDQETSATGPELLDVAFQTAEGYWQLADSLALDTTGRTVTAATRHFCDWSFLAPYRLNPPWATVPVDGARLFIIEHCFPVLGERPSPGADRPVLGHNWFPISVTHAAKVASNWSVNLIPGGNETIGTVYANLERGGYAAPSTKPNPDVVEVSVRIADWRHPEVQGILGADVTITDTAARIRVQGSYKMVDQLLTTFVTAKVTDGIEFEMPWPLADGVFDVTNLTGKAEDVADTRAGCIQPELRDAWDQLDATRVVLTGTYLTIEGNTLAPPITLGVGEGDCATTTRTEPAQTTEGGLQIGLPLEFFTSSNPPESPVVSTGEGWTLTYSMIPQ